MEGKGLLEVKGLVEMKGLVEGKGWWRVEVGGE